MKKIFILFFFTSNLLFSQNLSVKDSLINIATKSNNDSIKVAIFNKLAFNAIFKDINEAEFLLKKSFNSINNKTVYGYSDYLNIKGIYFDVKGNDSSLYYFNKCYNFSKKNSIYSFQTKAVNNLGMYYYNKTNFIEAQKYFYEALKLNDYLPLKNKISYSILFSNIGLIHQEFKQFDKALQFHKKALNIRIKENKFKEQCISYSNIGICYKGKNNLDKAIVAIKTAMEIASKNELLSEKLKGNTNLANIYIENKFFNNKLLIKITEKLLLEFENRKSEIQIAPISEFINYQSLAAYYLEIKNYDKSILYCNKAIKFTKSYPEFKNHSYKLYNILSNAYLGVGDLDNSTNYNSVYEESIKSNFSSDFANAIANLEAKYQTEKKEKELLKVKNDNILKEKKLKQRNYTLLVVFILLVGLGAIATLIIRQQKLKSKQQKQEFDLKQAIAKIETQNQLHDQKLAISRDLHDNIGSQLTFIISSVDNLKYGFEITNEKITNKLNNISSFAKETIVELRDTIWAMNHSQITFSDLKLRINNFIDKAQLATNVSVNFEIDENLLSKKFTSVQGMNLYRTIQEAVNNAIKYAVCTKINVAAIQENNLIKISITDNGKGFDLKTANLGNGLQNMKKRIEEIGGEFQINSKINNGTTIEIYL